MALPLSGEVARLVSTDQHVFEPIWEAVWFPVWWVVLALMGLVSWAIWSPSRPGGGDWVPLRGDLSRQGRWLPDCAYFMFAMRQRWY